MMNNSTPIRDYLVPGKRVHLVGIGGVSMCPLAEVLRGMGLTVQGSDMTDSDTVKHLRSLGFMCPSVTARKTWGTATSSSGRRPCMMKTQKSPAL